MLPTSVSKTGLLIVVLTFALAATVLIISAEHPFTAAQSATPVSGVNCTSYSDTFTIIASQSGYNDSIDHGTPQNHWPVLCAHVGSELKIIIINVDSVEPHGFAVAGYLSAGITVLPGRTESISILADSAGDYKIYCNVICAVHPFMQSGLLVISD
jgi:nitrous oxide reductase